MADVIDPQHWYLNLPFGTPIEVVFNFKSTSPASPLSTPPSTSPPTLQNPRVEDVNPKQPHRRLPIRQPTSDDEVLRRAGMEMEDSEMWDIHAPPKLYSLTRSEREKAVTGKPVYIDQQEDVAMEVEEPPVAAPKKQDALPISPEDVKAKPTARSAQINPDEHQANCDDVVAAVSTDDGPAQAPAKGRRMEVARLAPPRETDAGVAEDMEVDVAVPDASQLPVASEKVVKKRGRNAKTVEATPVEVQAEAMAEKSDNLEKAIEKAADQPEKPEKSEKVEKVEKAEKPVRASRKRGNTAASAVDEVNETETEEVDKSLTKKQKLEDKKDVDEEEEEAPKAAEKSVTDTFVPQLGKFMPGDAGSPWQFNLKYGTELEVYSSKYENWYPGRAIYYLVTDAPAASCKIKIHYQGFEKRFDETVDLWGDGAEADEPVLKLRPVTGDGEVNERKGTLVDVADMWDAAGNSKSHYLKGGMKEQAMAGQVVVRRGGGPKK
ncbi:hypothetical protein BC829DRAFT_413060 [Chytridium lagenaria]|nr:hypothetical protein BC829DRAFT_413060 [Chytridium lagenaria]